MTTAREGKVWVIEEERLRRERCAAETQDKTPPLTELAPLAGTRRNGTRTQPPPDVQSTSPSRPGGKPASWLNLLRIYALGPFALTPDSRAQRGGARGLRIILAVVLAAALAGSLLLREEDPLRGSAFVVGWLRMTAALILIIVTSWSVALWINGRRLRAAILRMPAVKRRLRFSAFLGLCAPGLGLMLAGRPIRAALAFWNLAPLFLSLTIFAAAITSKARAGEELSAAVWGDYERLLLGAGLMLIFSMLAWIAGALDGLRQLSRRAPGAGQLRGDRLALMLLASVILFTASFSPGRLAADLHGQSKTLAQQGYRLIPHHLSAAAMKLDSSRPEYGFATADYADALGRHQEAARIRSGLWLHWREITDCMLKAGDAAAERREAATDAVWFPDEG